MSFKSSELPSGWSTPTIGDVAAYLQRGKSPKYAKTSSLPVINQKCIRWGGLDVRYVKFINETQIPLWDEIRYLREKDILWNSTGTGTIGRACVYRGELERAVVDSHVTILRSDIQLIDPKFLFFFVMSPSVQDDIERMQSGSTNQVELSKKSIVEKEVPLPPLNEQKRIVEKIETLFARLDKGEEAIRQTQKLLKQYRQSVLKAAGTGELTADWRAEHQGQLEHGSDLLKRILKTRRENWQGRGKYKEPVEPDTTDLPELPVGWVWAKLDQLFSVLGGATPSRKEKSYWSGCVPWVTSGEVAFCRITDTAEKITEPGYQNCSTKLHPIGTILLAMIGEGKTRGQAAILDIPAYNNQNSAAIRVSETEVPTEYIYYFLMANYEDNRLKGQGGNQPALSGAKVKNFDVPVCSIEEMSEIAAIVESKLASSAQIEHWCDTELKRSAALRQSILKQAFSGKLVEQDPNDEPASELLARIKAEKEAQKTAAKKSKPKPRRKKSA